MKTISTRLRWWYNSGYKLHYDNIRRWIEWNYTADPTRRWNTHSSFEGSKSFHYMRNMPTNSRQKKRLTCSRYAISVIHWKVAYHNWKWFDFFQIQIAHSIISKLRWFFPHQKYKVVYFLQKKITSVLLVLITVKYSTDEDIFIVFCTYQATILDLGIPAVVFLFRRKCYSTSGRIFLCNCFFNLSFVSFFFRFRLFFPILNTRWIFCYLFRR